MRPFRSFFPFFVLESEKDTANSSWMPWKWLKVSILANLHHYCFDMSNFHAKRGHAHPARKCWFVLECFTMCIYSNNLQTYDGPHDSFLIVFNLCSCIHVQAKTQMHTTTATAAFTPSTLCRLHKRKENHIDRSNR